jgi:tRNA(fMet)-specific endonuclease VapC
MYVFDTDISSILQRGTGEQFDRLWAKVAQHPVERFYVSIVSFHEQVLGWNTYASRARDQAGVRHAYAMFQRTLAEFATAQVLPYDVAASDRLEALRKQKIRIGTMDLRIAAIALSRQMTLLTRNL